MTDQRRVWETLGKFLEGVAQNIAANFVCWAGAALAPPLMLLSEPIMRQLLALGGISQI